MHQLTEELIRMARQIEIATAAEVPEGEGREFVVDGRIIALFNVGGSYYALDGICPHAGGPLAEGRLHGCIVTCPWHGWQFDVSSGQHCLNNRLQQAAYRVTREGDRLLVELP